MNRFLPPKFLLMLTLLATTLAPQSYAAQVFPSKIEGFYTIGNLGRMQHYNGTNSSAKSYITVRDRVAEKQGRKLNSYTGKAQYNASKGILSLQPIVFIESEYTHHYTRCGTIYSYWQNYAITPIKNTDGTAVKGMWSAKSTNPSGECVAFVTSTKRCKVVKCHQRKSIKFIIIDDLKKAKELAKKRYHSSKADYKKTQARLDSYKRINKNNGISVNQGSNSLPGYNSRNGACGAISCSEADVNSYIIDQYFK